MTNLVELARQQYPAQHRCPCGIVVREVGGRWTDGAGVVHCQGGGHDRPLRERLGLPRGGEHVGVQVQVARSELLDPMRAILRGET